MRKKGILAVKLGYNPNSSSIGIGIKVLLWSGLAVSILFSFIAYMILKKKNKDVKK